MSSPAGHFSAHSRSQRIEYKLHDAKSLIRSSKGVDPWFLGRFGMNLYRGCEHGCQYCDGRAERYYVAGSFDRDITVKQNAVSLLDRELGRRKEPGFILLGGGVCDAYQPAERRFELARGVLEVVERHSLPLHVLTKSSLVERDFDLLSKIHAKSRVILSMSIQTLNEEVRRRLEPKAPPIARRFETLQRAKRLGFGVSVMVMPVLPGISDQPESIDALLGRAAEVGADFACGGSLTLRPGAQRDHYLDLIARWYPALTRGYAAAYRTQRPSGAPEPSYASRVDARFRAARQQHGLPGRAPHALFAGLMPEYTEVAVLLEHEAVRRFDERVDQKLDRTLPDAGWAIQQWAQRRIAREGRRKGFSHLGIQAEFRTLCASGELHRVIPMPESVTVEVRRLLEIVLAARRRRTATPSKENSA